MDEKHEWLLFGIFAGLIALYLYYKWKEQQQVLNTLHERINWLTAYSSSSNNINTVSYNPKYRLAGLKTPIEAPKLYNQYIKSQFDFK